MKPFLYLLFVLLPTLALAQPFKISQFPNASTMLAGDQLLVGRPGITNLNITYGQLYAQIVGSYWATNFASSNVYLGYHAGNGFGLSNLNATAASVAGFITTNNSVMVSVYQLGITNDGVTDFTPALQAAINYGMNPWFPANVANAPYLLSEFTLTNNTSLAGNGARLFYNTGPTHTNIFIRGLLNMNVSLHGLILDGGNYSGIVRQFHGNGTLWTLTTGNTGESTAVDNFQYWYPGADLARCGLQYNSDGGGEIANMKFVGFSGAAVVPVSMCQSAGAQYQLGKTTFRDSEMQSNFVGLLSSGEIALYFTGVFPAWITNYVPGVKVGNDGAQVGACDPEYCTYTGLEFHENTFGAVWDCANTIFSRCLFNDDYCNVNTMGGDLNGHGSITGCFFNHALNYSFYAANQIDSGEIFMGNQLRGGPPNVMFIYRGSGYQIKNNGFNPLALVATGTAGANNIFHENMYSSTLSSGTFSVDSTWNVQGNMSESVNTDFTTNTIPGMTIMKSVLALPTGTVVASATTITPLGQVFHVSGVTAIATINLPFTGFTGSITLIPDGIWSTTTAGNISLASTAVVNKALVMTYDGTKWNPSY